MTVFDTVSTMGAPVVRTAPAGGPLRGRGCSIAVMAFVAAAAASAETVPVPSGLDISFFDVIQDVAGDGYTYRFRFVAPAIAGDVDFAAVAADMDLLCSEYALPRVPYPGPRPNRIVISLMSEPTEFGVMNPEVIQFFESYSIENDLCIWEAF